MSWIRKYSLIIVLLLAFAIWLVWWTNSRGYDDSVMAAVPQFSDSEQTVLMQMGRTGYALEPSYYSYYKQALGDGGGDTADIHIAIAAIHYSASSKEGVSRRPGLGGDNRESVVLEEETGWVEYEVEIPRDGFYNVGLSYLAMEGKGSAVQYSMQIDGEYPFFQSKRLIFPRIWEEDGEVRYDRYGNQFNPKQREVEMWQFRLLRDAEARVEEPFRYYLAQGKHRIRLEAVREPSALRELVIASPLRLPSYEEVRASYEVSGLRPSSDHFIKVQAEEAVRKSDPTLRRYEEKEPATEPYRQEAITLNTIGGTPWYKGGQWMEWEVEVPESGLYHIGTRFMARWLNYVPVQRTVYIDGEIPFREMQDAQFPFAVGWQVEGLDAAEEPYLFYLEKGKRVIRMEQQTGDMGEVFEYVQQVASSMSALSREIILITGTNPDPNRQWELSAYIPRLSDRLYLMARQIDEAMGNMHDMGVKQNSAELSVLGMARDQLADMAKRPDTIPARLDNFSTTQSSLGEWMNNMSKMRVQLDYLVVKSPNMDWPRAQASLWEKLSANAYHFLASFTKDYSQIGATGEEGGELDVWIARGRDWVQIIKAMADEEFTPRTGVKVNVNIIPAQAMQLLMLASTTGNTPDVALGVEADIPIDFALRNALQELDAFPDYEEIAGRFRPGALIPFQYNGRHYALPENQNFYMLFYRKDVMEELGIRTIPDTWDEVMELIPLLHQNGMDFYYPRDQVGALSQFSSFLFQHDGEFYRNGGRQSSLDNAAALDAMKMWTGLYTNYKINKEANFYNRFRTGEMPIGVADYQTYVLLATAAPELTGWWGMKPMPGIRQVDGQVNRSTGGAAQTAIIFKDTEMKEEAWEFLKWWTSAAAQERFGEELEAIIGVEARWNTANVEALTNLPWPSEDIASILSQWDWFREREIVPGGYYTNRYIHNIWNEIVVNGKTPREALEEGVKEINKEIRKKREEFGLDTAGERR